MEVASISMFSLAAMAETRVQAWETLAEIISRRDSRTMFSACAAATLVESNSGHPALEETMLSALQEEMEALSRSEEGFGVASSSGARSCLLYGSALPH